MWCVVYRVSSYVVCLFVMLPVLCCLFHPFVVAPWLTSPSLVVFWFMWVVGSLFFRIK